MTARRPRLREDDAWSIATTWSWQLRGNVRLVLDRDGPVDSIVESYAWVRLDDPTPPASRGVPSAVARQLTTSVARAVMISWAALASCPGFSGLENGPFWKRVVNELQPQTIRRRRAAVGDEISDAYGFFDQSAHGFPRFMVDATTESGAVFAGMLQLEVDLDPGTRSTL